MTTSETVGPPLALTLFGPIQIRVQGQPLPHLRSRKTLWLLALLILRHDRPVEREWLAGTLWPDVDQSQAFANLRPILSDLRSALRDQGERLRSPTRPTLLLDLTDAEVDVLTFDNAIASGKLSALKQAVELYRAPLLEGCLEEWVHQEREVRAQACLRALQKLAEAASTAGDYDTACGYYQRVISLDSWSDAARRGLMEALARNGDRNAALQVYRDFLNVLRSDPTAVPDPLTSALYARLRAEMRQSVGTTAPPAANEVATAIVSGYLPHPLTELVGREDERLEVAARMRRSRLVTLTGVGGIGKTRLAIEVATQVVGEYVDGVWLVALEAVSEGKRVPQQIASVLGLKEETGHSWLQSVTEALRNKRLLLVLDNCEHLLTESAAVVGHLLRECSHVRLLATSREALGITGETAWSVPSLAVPDPAHLPQGQATLLRVVRGYESVQLFVERAQAADMTFVLTGNNARLVAEMCFRLEGMPLAIELAAARVKAMTVEQIASRLHDHLGLLTMGNRVALPRQQTLRAMLDWSYALLNEEEQLLLRRLSIFAGGWSLEAAEGICAGPGVASWQVLNVLSSLVDKSLVTFGEREDGGRYRFLEMVRQYAVERLQASGEAEQIQRRHRDWFVLLTEEAEPQLTGPEQVRWLQRLDTEYDNLRAALVLCGVEAEGAEAGLRLTGALWRFWYVRGHYSEGRKYLDLALKREEAQARTTARAKALNGAVTLAIIQGEYASARALCEESMSLFRELGDKQGIAVAAKNLGNMAYRQGEFALARALCAESLSLYRELGDKQGIAVATNNLGNVDYSQGEYALAWALYEESLSIRRELKGKRGIASTLYSLSNVAIDRGEYASARALCEESVSLYRELGDKQGIAGVLNNLGNVAHAQGEYAVARALYEESVSLYRELGDRQSVALATSNLGNVAQAQGEYTLAQALCAESLSLHRELGDKRGIACSLHNLGNVAIDRGEYAVAWALYEESVSIRRELKEKPGVVESLEGLAAVLQAQAAAQKAVCLWGAVHALRASLGMAQLYAAKEAYEQRVRQARSALGEEVFTAAWEEGCAMTWEQAIAYAFEQK